MRCGESRFAVESGVVPPHSRVCGVLPERWPLLSRSTRTHGPCSVCAVAHQPESPRKQYRLKARSIEPVDNPPVGANPGAGANDVHALIREATRHDPPQPWTAPTSAPHTDVHVLLQDNLRRANEAGANDVKDRPRRRSRRKRDYIVASTIGNLVLLVCTAISPIFGAAGLIIYNVGLTWVVWVVMDDY